MKRLLILVFLVSAAMLSVKSLWAQSSGFLDSKNPGDTTGQSLFLNQKDTKGDKQGLWYLRTEPRMMQDGFIAFGHYVDNQKQGMWYRMDDLGRLVSIKTYLNDVLNGPSQYYRQGNLVCIGNFRGLNPKNELDSFWVVKPNTGEDTLVIVPSSMGSVKHGLWRYYSPVSGRLVKEERYQVGQLIYKKEFHKLTAADSLHYEKMPKYRQIDKKKSAKKIPDYAKRKISY